MSRKLHRGRTRVFHKRKFPVKAVAWLLAAAVIIPGSFFGAKYMLENRPASQPDVSVPPVSRPADASSQDSSQPADPSEPNTPAAGGALKAFYLPTAQLADSAKLSAALSAAKAAGLNAVVFDLKDSEGNLLYASATELAQQAQSAGSGALTLDALKAAFDQIGAQGMAPVPRLYAFQDHVAPRQLSAAKITLPDQPTWTWYDGDPKNGGRPWLNPYSPVAHRYITDMIKELKTLGASTVLLDGVQFPKRTSGASFGNTEYASQSKAEVLATFIASANTAMDGGRVILSAPGLAALGTDTTVYGGNPVTFGAGGVAPVLMPATLGSSLTAGDAQVEAPASHPYEAVKAALAQIQLRLQVIDQAKRPALTPWLQGYDCSADAIKEQIRAVTEVLGKDASYLLYNPGGAYDFAALS